MTRSFAIGDIHGCCQTFKKLVFEEIKLKPGDVLYCIGDYIDRGPDSKGVIDFILRLREEGYAVHTLRGNHEQMMIDSIRDEDHDMDWRYNGGLATLRSFGIDSFDQMKIEYRRFFEETRFYIEIENYLLVHAGLNFELPDPFEDLDAMLWTRGMAVKPEKIGNRILVHGHTPILFDQILTQSGPVINIDAGCVYAERENMGYLVAFELGTHRFIAERNAD